MGAIITHGEAETVALGERLAQQLAGGDIVLLAGDLGAGKTRFAKGVARGLGLACEVTSPTFNLVLEYRIGGGDEHECEAQARGPVSQGEAPGALPEPRARVQLLRHFDLYRLEAAEQLDDLDYFGLLEDGEAVSLVEWGNRFAEALPEAYLLVELCVVVGAPEQRAISLTAQGARYEQLLAELRNV